MRPTVEVAWNPLQGLAETIAGYGLLFRIG